MALFIHGSNAPKDITVSFQNRMSDVTITEHQHQKIDPSAVQDYAYNVGYDFTQDKGITRHLALHVQTYLQNKNPISALYQEPLIQNDVYNFLVKKAGSKKIAETILFFVERENLPIETVFALVYTESKFKTNALSANSNSQDVGLFQLNSTTFWHLSLEELFDLETNVKLGIKYLKYGYTLMSSTNNALAVYNAGPSRPLRGIIPATTQEYIKKINIYMRQLIKEFTQYMRIKYSLSDLEGS